MKNLTFIATCFILALATNICLAQVIVPKPEPCEDELDMSFTATGFQSTGGIFEIGNFISGNQLIIFDSQLNPIIITFVGSVIPQGLQPGTLITIRKSQGLCGGPAPSGLFVFAAINVTAN